MNKETHTHTAHHTQKHKEVGEEMPGVNQFSLEMENCIITST